MKPLTFEELKALPCGEPVWLIPQGPIPYAEKYYYKNDSEDIDETHEIALYDEHDEDDVIVTDSDYGTKWLSYKNKECAEAQGEIVELPCALGCTVYTLDDDKIEEWEVIGVLVQDSDAYIKIFNKQSFICKLWGVKSIFFNKSVAEARLQELRGEK